MSEYPRAKAAVADVIKARMKKVGKKAAGVSRELGENQHYMRRILTQEREVSCHELIAAIAPALYCDGWALLKEAEEQFKAPDVAGQRRSRSKSKGGGRATGSTTLRRRTAKKA